MAFISFQPHDHFDVPVWTGSDSTTTVNGLAFKPDSIWIKNYSATGNTQFNNSTTGISKNWQVGSIAVINTETFVASYTSDGFTLTGNKGDTNNASDKYLGACWKANGGTTASNTTGSINSTVQANTTSGISIVKWTGTSANGTIGHGIGAAPKIILAKANTSNVGACLNMGKTFVADPATDYMQFAWTNATLVDGADRWNDTAPTSSVFSIGATTQHNSNGQECIAYCFAEVKGFSKFGFYSGTGNIAGTKVYCGFRPKYVIIKSCGTTDDWGAKSSEVIGYGIGGKRTRDMKLNTTGNQTSGDVQFESNGFRPVSTSTGNNKEDTLYWYMAFAEMPMVASNGTIALGA